MAKMNSFKRSLTRKQPLESLLSGGANLFLNHHVLLLTVILTQSSCLSHLSAKPIYQTHLQV